MARVKYIKKSQTERRCHAGHVIPKGSSYSYAAPGYHARTIFACSEHPFKGSDLASSPYKAQALSAIESFDTAVGSIDHEDSEAIDQLTTAFEDLTSEFEDILSQREEALDSWENGNSMLEELKDTAQNNVDELQNHTVEEWSGDDEALAWNPEEHPEPEDDESEEWDEWNTAKEDHEQALSDYASHIEDQINEATEVVGGLDV
jgi:chromosome segregation ATPase